MLQRSYLARHMQHRRQQKIEKMKRHRRLEAGVVSAECLKATSVDWVQRDALAAKKVKAARTYELRSSRSRSVPFLLSLVLHVIAALIGGIFVVSVAKVDDDAIVAEITRVEAPRPKRELSRPPVPKFSDVSPKLAQAPRLTQPVTTSADIPSWGARFTLPSSELYADGDETLSGTTTRGIGDALGRRIVSDLPRADVTAVTPDLTPQRMVSASITAKVEAELPQMKLVLDAVETPEAALRDVTQAPRFLHKVLPQYPDTARRAEKEGVVLLDARIDVDGTAKDIVVLKGIGFGLEEAAIQALKASRFAPARRDGAVIATRIQIPYRFKLETSSI